MWGTIPIGYRLLGGFVLLAAVFTAGVFFGWLGPHNALVQYRAEVAQVAADQNRIAKAKDAENQRIAKETESAYQTQLDGNTAYWTKRLRNYNCTGIVSKYTGTPTGTNETASEPLPDSRSIIIDCQATTVQLEALQKWVRDTR